MGTFSDVLGAVFDSRKMAAAESEARARAAHSAGAAGFGLGNAYKAQQIQNMGDEGKFFSRAFDSVARRARQSVLLFPLVISDSVSPEAAGRLARALQVRSAEYVRLAVANMDTVAVSGDEKTRLISTIRGASLSDAIMGEDCAAVNSYLERNLAECARQAARRPAALAAPIGMRESGEGDPAHGFGFAGDDDAEHEPNPASQRGQGGPTSGGGAMGSRFSSGAHAAAAGLTTDQPEPRDRDAKRAAPAGKPGEGANGPAQQVKDDVNAFAPTMLQLTFRYRPAPDAPDTSSTLLLGVKTQVHTVPSADLVDGIGRALHKDSIFLQFLRLTSGEISFISDFILNIQAARTAATPRASAASKALIALQRQAHWNKERGNWLVANMTKRGFVPPTSTIAISADEAARIKQRYSVDLLKAGEARAMLQSHNLMGIVVVDEALGYVRIFEDGDDDFDRIPMAELDGQGRKGEGNISARDLMTIMAKR